jgi:16S rRNA (adenine1518-N6/adenine1519-N6)-dimethyltransferase
VGNLPYQITGLALRMILGHMHLLSGALITVQQEVADRMLSSPGSKAYGALSVAAQYHCHPQAVLHLPASSFYPRPEVNSTTLFLEPRPEPPVRVIDEALFFSLIKTLFGHRRKTAKNALRSKADLHLTAGQLQLLPRQSSVDLDRRAETMNLQELAQISNAIWEMQHA